MPWLKTVDSILFSHIWLGAWSTLTVRSWMYHALYAVMALAAVGLIWRCRGAAITILAGYYAAFWAGQLWHAALLQSVWGIATSLGDYLNAVGGAEAMLCVAGVRALAPPAARRWVAPAGVALMAVFDFYTLQMVALPYYAGLTVHRANGTVAAFHPAGTSLAEWVARLAMFKSPLLPEGVLWALWAGYAAATLALVAIVGQLARES